MGFILCILGLLCFALCTAENKEAEERFESLQLPPLDKLHDTLESVNRLNLIDFIHKLSKYENGIVHQEFRETEKNRKRGAETGLTTRRPCRVFFWKSWASC
ncbi:hypothetical protein CHARACLAT_026850 [Characodon lateralis]|uniref:Somatostatin/Cortistatin C-terminal domain-containing protein n=1 Tax=Characodon lateralis TaxID=208331 RepID=A0ABU7EX24_9TELE|nr:hypothetical protein [Characodon lateralis]